MALLTTHPTPDSDRSRTGAIVHDLKTYRQLRATGPSDVARLDLQMKRRHQEALSRWYGRPSAAGARLRPINPARTTIVIR